MTTGAANTRSEAGRTDSSLWRRRTDSPEARPEAVSDPETVDRVAAAAAADLLAAVAAGAHPFGAASAALAMVADELHLDHVSVAVDDPELGRQVFASKRRPLADHTAGLWGDPRVHSDPPIDFGPTASGLLVGGIALALRPITTAVEPRITPAPAPVVDLVDLADNAPRLRRSSCIAYEQVVASAVARARRHGWSITLARLHFEEPVADADALLGEVLREGDAVGVYAPDEVSILFAATPGDEVPRVLHRAARIAGLPPLSFGLAACPGDTTDAETLTTLAERRLAEALHART